MIVDKVNAFLNAEGKTIDEAILADIASLSKNAFLRQFGTREERKAGIRLSSIGRCVRQQAYKLLGYEENGKAIDARAKTVFFMGDLTEIAIIGLAKAAGCDVSATGDKQSSVEIDGVVGHPDGLLRDSGETLLLEVKSMSSYSFKEFERGVLEIGYRYQCNAYMEALKLKRCVIVALNKDAGVLAEMVISIDPEIVQNIKERIKQLRAATQESLPERPYKPDTKGFYPWVCLYCPVHFTCLPNAEKVLVSNKYKLKETPKHVATPTP